MTTKECPFCLIAKGLTETELIAESEYSVAFADGFPLNEGHTLIIPRSHKSNLFELSSVERKDAWTLLDTVYEKISELLKPDGFNVGVNVSELAGQTIDHAHIHLIPRFKGDVSDPKGGVRWVIPERAPYWE